MFGRPLYRQRPGRPIQARTINAPADAAGRFARLRAGTGLAQSWLAGIPLLRRLAGATERWARITGAPTAGKYPWRGIYPVAGGAWADLPATVSDNGLTSPAYEANGDATVPVGIRVVLRRGAGGDWRFQMTHC